MADRARGGFTPSERQSWIWAAIPAGSTRVDAGVDPELARTVREAGLEVGSEAAGAFVARLGDGALEAAAASDATVVAVSVGGGRAEVRDRVPRARRAVERLAAPLEALLTAIRARRVARALGDRGRQVVRLQTGDRSRTPYAIGHAIWRRGTLPLGAVVIARAERSPTTLEAAIARAGEAAGEPLAPAATRVVETGKVLVELGGERTGYVLRLAAGRAAGFLDAGVAAVDALGRDAAPEVADRLVPALARGAVGVARYTLEERVPGRHPRRLDDELWDQCLEFLLALRRAPVAAAATGSAERLDADLETLAGFAGARSAVLARLGGELRRRLEGLGGCWGHGDFWLENLIVSDGRLVAVLDWETALPASLPLLDLLDLIALSRPGEATLTPGPRLTRSLLPLAAERGDARVRAYCEAAGIPLERPVLEALAIAYWIDRTARDLRDTPDRAHRPRWIAANVAAPLAALEGRWP